MKKTRKWMLPIAATSIAGMLVAGTGYASVKGAAHTNAAKAVDGGTLTFGEFSDIVNLNPLYIQDTASGDAANFIFASVYDTDRTGKPIADGWSLAAVPPIISKDGLTYTVKLKHTAKWSDGVPVTADDLVYTWMTEKNPVAASPAISGFQFVKSIQKVDQWTVKITLKSVDAPFVYTLTGPVVPFHVLKNTPVNKLQTSDYGTSPETTVTDGPWKWTAWQQKQYLKFDRDTKFWGTKPHIQTVVMKEYADQNTEIQALLKGDIDLVSAIPVTQLGVVQGHGINVLKQAGPLYEFIGFNFKPSNWTGGFVPFAGIKTRQAIMYAMNRPAMVSSILKGTGTIMNSPFLPGSWVDPEKTTVHYTYNPSKAKQLLKADGWRPGPDGILTKNGHKFTFDMIFNTGNSRRAEVGAVIQQELRAVGIQVKLDPMDFTSETSQHVNVGKYQAYLGAWQMGSPDPDPTSTYSSTYFPPAGQNAGFWKDPTADKLMVQGVATSDQNARKAVYQKLAKEMSTNLPAAWLYQYGTPEGLSSRIHWANGDQPQLSLGYGYFFDLQKWWVTN